MDIVQRDFIHPGQTLAQLCRANKQAVNEVFAIAQVQGNDKPLSNMQGGQEVRIERDANGTINKLSITIAGNRQALFRWQGDSSRHHERY